MTEPRYTCECCGETWEASFFREETELVERRVPDPMWECAPIDDDTIFVEERVSRLVCLNCCA